MLDSIRTAGFPYGLDMAQLKISVRAFAGEIVSTQNWSGLSAKPEAYELLFQCPRGLSGAPLWVPLTTPVIVGMIIGNCITEMIIHSEKEESTEDGKTTIYERTESLRLGLAVQTKPLTEINSQLLGSTVEAFLRERNRLA